MKWDARVRPGTGKIYKQARLNFYSCDMGMGRWTPKNDPLGAKVLGFKITSIDISGSVIFPI